MVLDSFHEHAATLQSKLRSDTKSGQIGIIQVITRTRQALLLVCLIARPMTLSSGIDQSTREVCFSL